MNTILIVDDEVHMRNLIETIVKSEGYHSVHAADATKAMDELLSQQIDLMLIDVMMPGQDGFELCKKVRQISKVPIIFLTARDANEDKVNGLLLGADDYIVKPFSASELMARITAVLRRSGDLKLGAEQKLIVQGSIELNEVARKVTVNAQEVSLTLKEFELLYLFMRNPNIVFSREQLLTSVWNSEYEGGTRTVDTHIKTLRLKLGKISKEASESIQTIWGIGYRFEVVQ